MTRVVAYLATSLDGFIATKDDEVAWLERPRATGLPIAAGEWAATEPAGLEFDDFLADVGCIVMGRRTLEVVAGFDGPWAYGDTPMLILTSRDLPEVPDSVRAVSGSIRDAIAHARELAGGRDVYVDGGKTIRATLDAGLLDHLIVTMLPTALGDGIPLLAGLEHAAEFTLERVDRWGPGLVQLHLTTRGPQADSAA